MSWKKQWNRTCVVAVFSRMFAAEMRIASVARTTGNYVVLNDDWWIV